MHTMSEKQREYRRLATKVWNVKTGATRSGKTYGDYFILPRRLAAGRGREGLNVLLGSTKGTLTRNLILPMQAIYGPTHPSSTATATRSPPGTRTCSRC